MIRNALKAVRTVRRVVENQHVIRQVHVAVVVDPVLLHGRPMKDRKDVAVVAGHVNLRRLI